MIRVGYVAHTGGLSGPNNSLMRLLQALDRSKFEPVLYFPDGGSAVTTFSEMGERCRVVPMASLARSVARVPTYAADTLRVTWRLRQAFRADRLNLVHINTCVTPYAGVAARSLRLPLVWHVRECLRPNAINDLYLRGLVQLATRVVAVSGAVRAHVERRVRRALAKAVVINNGIDLDRFSRAMTIGKTRQELGLPNGPRLIVVPAFLLPHKGHETLIEAAAVLVHDMKLTDFCVLLAGDEPPEDHGQFTARLIELRRRLGLEHHVALLGLRHDLPAVLAHADIVCLPSTCEDSFPNGVLEGMAAGKPVIASRVGGIPELVDDGLTGWLVDKGQPRPLALALAQLLGDHGLAARMGTEGRQRVEQRFTGRQHAARIQDLYDELGRSAD